MHANATPSEIAIFNKLANPARVSKTPRDPVAKPQSVFETAVIQELKSVAMNREQEREKAGSDRDDKSDRGGDQSDRGRDKVEESHQHRDELDRRSSSQELETSRNNDAEVFAEQQREKEAMIDYINARATRGVRVTKTYTRDDPFVDVQFEYDRIKINEETTNSLGIAREGLRFACKAVEAGNKKFGPILALDGWVDNHMAPDTMGRFDNVLERLYKKHWRKGSMAPEMELLMLLGGSMAMTHFDNVSGKRGASPASNQPPPFARPHSSGPLPFDIMSMLSPKKASAPPQRPPLAPAPPVSPPQQQPQPPSGTGVRRPMRRPVDSMSVASEPETVLSKPETTDLQDADNRMKLEMMQEQNRQRERAMQASVQAARQEAMIKDRLQQIEAMEFQVRQRELAMEQRLRSLELKESRQHMESDFKKQMTTDTGRGVRELYQPPPREMQQREMQQREMQQREMQQREMQQREMQQREMQQREQQQREMQQREMQQREMQQREMQQREMQQQREQHPSKEDEDSEPQEEGAVTSQGEDSGNASDSRSVSVPDSHGHARRGRGSRRRKAPKNLRV